jgi:hypothetical protein
MTTNTLSHDAANIDKAEQAYQQWRELNRRSINNDLSDADWEVVDAAERAVLNCTEKTPRAAERKLWLSLMHDIDGREFAPWILAEDVAGLQNLSVKIDLPQRLQVSAIASLQGLSQAMPAEREFHDSLKLWQDIEAAIDSHDPNDDAGVDALADQATAAEMALSQYPAPSLGCAALRASLMFERYDDINNCYPDHARDTIRADIAVLRSGLVTRGAVNA